MTERINEFAKKLRREQTPHEAKLWKHLRAKRFYEKKFRRQQPIGKYIVDFVCFQEKLIIELDGSQHIDNKDKDELRDEWLRSEGFKVIRFYNTYLIILRVS